MTIRIDVIATIPRMIEDFRNCSIIARAAENNIVSVVSHDLRNYAADRHRSIDDRPFGGGAGMVLMPEPIFKCLDEITSTKARESRMVLLSPRGKRFDQQTAEDYAGWLADKPDRGLIMICGRYEGIDERVVDFYRPELVSIGDYVIIGGEVAAMVMIESIARLIPGVVGNEESIIDESFSEGNLEYPQYTRPAEFRGMKVPDVLLSGNHGEICKWRKSKLKKLK